MIMISLIQFVGLERKRQGHHQRLVKYSIGFIFIWLFNIQSIDFMRFSSD